MAHSIDHILVLVRDLAAASADYAAAGFTVTPGGVHADGTTHNALIPFADGTYLELIAPTRGDRLPDEVFGPRLQRGEGLVDYALGAADLDVEAARSATTMVSPTRRVIPRAWRAAASPGTRSERGVTSAMRKGNVTPSGWTVSVRHRTRCPSGRSRPPSTGPVVGTPMERNRAASTPRSAAPRA